MGICKDLELYAYNHLFYVLFATTNTINNCKNATLQNNYERNI